MSIFLWSPVEPCPQSEEGLEHKREANLYSRASYQGPDANDLFIYLIISGRFQWIIILFEISIAFIFLVTFISYQFNFV